MGWQESSRGGEGTCNGVRGRERVVHWEVKSSSGERAGKGRIRSSDSPTPKSRLGASLLCLCIVLIGLPPPNPPKKYSSDNSRDGQPNTTVPHSPLPDCRLSVGCSAQSSGHPSRAVCLVLAKEM